MSRAVIITGIPFAPVADPKVKLKKQFLDDARRSAGQGNHPEEGGGGFLRAGGVTARNMLSGDEWHQQTAHRAVNQAVGRVIRNRSDCGAVLLLDERFDHPKNREGLSGWVRGQVLPDMGFGRAHRDLAQFCANHKSPPVGPEPVEEEIRQNNNKRGQSNSQCPSGNHSKKRKDSPTKA